MHNRKGRILNILVLQCEVGLEFSTPFLSLLCDAGRSDDRGSIAGGG
jgi:hypothetical protein